MSIDKVLFIPIIASFFVTLFLIPPWIKKTKQIGLLWEDMNKSRKEKVAGSGGIIAVLGFVIGIFIKKVLSDMYGQEVAESIPLLYGGSAEEGNTASLLKEGGADGLLVGHASLDAERFIKMLKSANAI